MPTQELPPDAANKADELIRALEALLRDAPIMVQVLSLSMALVAISRSYPENRSDILLMLQCAAEIMQEPGEQDDKLDPELPAAPPATLAAAPAEAGGQKARTITSVSTNAGELSDQQARQALNALTEDLGPILVAQYTGTPQQVLDAVKAFCETHVRHCVINVNGVPVPTPASAPADTVH